MKTKTQVNIKKIVIIILSFIVFYLIFSNWNYIEELFR